jgi:hypothetical protein
MPVTQRQPFASTRMSRTVEVRCGTADQGRTRKRDDPDRRAEVLTRGFLVCQDIVCWNQLTIWLRRIAAVMSRVDLPIASHRRSHKRFVRLL